ncbi:MAG: tetratricopeptide repeat protein [Bacteroides sp.]|nr:tetratricopeptide repeat protein [Bacteroides sp.]MCM1378856.1 tetratricopeptide repeat protein [Bacteroides sp.]MCM1445473.1 tetratricopeptide repeat protein [Prevotella sp.]
MKRYVLLLIMCVSLGAAMGEIPTKRVDATLRGYAAGEVDEEAVAEIVAETDSLSRERIIVRFERLGRKSADIAQLEAAVMHAWGMYGRAMDVYARLVAAGNHDADIYRWYADCVGRVNGDAAAHEVLTEAVGLYPDDGNLKLALAQADVSCGRYEEAIELLDILIDANPGNYDLLREKINALNALKASLKK